jgi:hypothetical protein
MRRRVVAVEDSLTRAQQHGHDRDVELVDDSTEADPHRCVVDALECQPVTVDPAAHHLGVAVGDRRAILPRRRIPSRDPVQRQCRTKVPSARNWSCS